MKFVHKKMHFCKRKKLLLRKLLLFIRLIHEIRYDIILAVNYYQHILMLA